MKRIIYILLPLLFILIGCNGGQNEEDHTTVVVHYHRVEGDYTDWNVSAWEFYPEKSNEETIQFDKENDFGKVARLDLDGTLKDSERIGIKISKDDNNVDLSKAFIDVLEIDPDENNEIHIWFIEGQSTISFKELSTEPEIKNVELIKKNVISVDIDRKISSSTEIDVTGSFYYGYNIESLDYTEDGTRVLITLDRTFDLTNRRSKVIVGELEETINVDSFYDSDYFIETYTYEGDDLGVTYNDTTQTFMFRVWAPLANEMKVNIYDAGKDGIATTYSMEEDVNGTWVYESSEALFGKYYTYTVSNFDDTFEVVDPYAKSAGINGSRGMIVDLDATNPEYFNTYNRPELVNREDSIIYELHVRDLSTDPNSGIEEVGTFLGIVEEGTSYTDPSTGMSVTTGLDHLKELGITHLHLLPSFDHANNEVNAEFNWGYNPLNYNVPEGSYSTNAYDGNVRVNEFKQMVQKLHQNDIRVVMDVVYNHTGPSQDSNLNKLVPNYYYRLVNGHFANGSGCGNELASERLMVRKLMVDSVSYWATEYNIDGFRFDLMALHDVETMNQIRTTLNEIDDSIIVYGEPWDAGGSPLRGDLKAGKHNIHNMPGVAAFNDTTRDGMKGSPDGTDQGFIQNGYREGDVKFGITGGTSGWAIDPEQVINYASAHDNKTLWDKLTHSAGSYSLEERILMHKQANAIVLTSQGIPFLHAGTDFLRTKDGDHNSYESSDEINQLEWTEKLEYVDVFNYHKGLIELRQAHPAFRMTTKADINENLSFITNTQSGVIGYTIENNANNDAWGTILVLFNGKSNPVDVTVPHNGTWNIVVDENQAGTEVLRQITGNEIQVSAHGTIVAYLD
ncbi:type I pullulanase [Haloplasma contractile]|uniref:pullulanase n=1 Tax=Haloplasma contractile SSD-17B TaxID=1033810 RepID=U2EEE8_9MOLU|nr:type I pullulanase [Haloplasma contractile]ERJ13071.1 pyrophosphate--fructose-6-phosphate 1-phosphotransferase protein [Haloplasma contractile SSD-17B]